MKVSGLTMISLCLSLVALGLVSLAGCQVQDPGHLKTAAETMQVPSLPEMLSRQVLLCPCLLATLGSWNTLELLNDLAMLYFSILLN
jgi:hypothetical protein